MDSGWDCTSSGYVTEWLPQFAPYDSDLVRELDVREGDVVLTTAGAEAIALARAVGDSGAVHAVDSRAVMCALCKERIASAGLAKRASVIDAARGPYDVVAFADADDLGASLRVARGVLAPNGKVGARAWGPDAETDPERTFARAIEEIAPRALAPRASRLDVSRAGLTTLFETAGLALVRHTLVSHAIVFPAAARFARSLLAARAYGPRLAAMGEEKVAAVLARFYERVGGEGAPITYAPTATIVVAGLPGAELELPHRPSVRIPAVRG